MRYLLSLVCVVAMVASPMSASAQGGEAGPTSAPLVVHSFLPPQLMLRASYYLYLDADVDKGVTSDQTEAKAEEPKSAQADGEVATSESNLEESVSSPAPGTEVPDIDTLSQRAIEHYEIHYATQSEERKKQERRRRRRVAIGVPIAVAAVVAFAVVLGVGLSWANSSD